MIELTTSDKEILKRLIRSEYDNLENQIDNSRYYQLIEIAEKLYLSNDFIQEMKKDL